MLGDPERADDRLSWVKLLTIPYRHLYSVARLFFSLHRGLQRQQRYVPGRRDRWRSVSFGYVLLQLRLFHPAPICSASCWGRASRKNFRRLC